MKLADLDRDELLALAEKYCPPAALLDLARTRLDLATRRERAAYADWRAASDRARTDAQAARRRSETHGYDASFAALFGISKKSTAKAAQLWAEYEKAARRRAALELDLRRMKKGVAA